MQQAVNAAQINECTVVSEVLNDTFNFHAFLQVFQQLIALCAVFGFDNGTTRNNNVVALLIQLDYFEFKLFAFQCRVSRTGRTSTREPGRNARIPFSSTVKLPLTLPLITPVTVSASS